MASHIDDFKKVSEIKIATPKDLIQRTPQSWMNPLNKLKWADAVKVRKKEVVIEGVLMSIDYNKRQGIAWVSPADGSLVPCGEINLERVDSGLFITGQ